MIRAIHRSERCLINRRKKARRSHSTRRRKRRRSSSRKDTRVTPCPSSSTKRPPRGAGLCFPRCSRTGRAPFGCERREIAQTKKPFNQWLSLYQLAEREGFEPPLGCPKPDFESGAFDHSAISPRTADYTGFAYPAARRKGRSKHRAREMTTGPKPPHSYRSVVATFWVPLQAQEARPEAAAAAAVKPPCP